MKLLKFIPIILLTFSTTTTLACSKPLTAAAVSKNTCSKVAHATQPFILVLNSDDDFIASITQCAKDAKLLGASVSGLGQLHNPTLAYFSSDPNAKPSLTKFDGYYELASVNGNITKNANQYYTHLHAVLADNKFHGIAGHVNDAKVGLTVELTIVPLSATVQRKVDEKTGFGIIEAATI